MMAEAAWLLASILFDVLMKVAAVVAVAAMGAVVGFAIWRHFKKWRP